MDNNVTVPITWLFGVGLLLLGAFTWWLRTEWSRNWKEHDAMTTAASKAHSELDGRIDSHHDKIDKHVGRLHNRIDWIIQNHSGMPPYPVENDD